MRVIAAHCGALARKHVNLYIAEDTYRPYALAGNKRLKLLPNLQFAKRKGYAGVLSFGGAYSNHIHALAFMAQTMKLPSIGVIRGESSYRDNPTLRDAARWGMHLEFVSRKQYQQRHDHQWQERLLRMFPDVYILPEGGSNDRAVRNCQKLLKHIDEGFINQVNLFSCAVGSGATLCGLRRCAPAAIPVRGYSVVADCTREVRMQSWLQSTCNLKVQMVEVETPRYGKLNATLARFIDQFYLDNHILLDPVYTGKALWQLERDIQSDVVQVQGDILFIHTGGIQGWRGFLPEFESELSAETKGRIRQMTEFEDGLNEQT